MTGIFVSFLKQGAKVLYIPYIPKFTACFSAFLPLFAVYFSWGGKIEHCSGVYECVFFSFYTTCCVGNMLCSIFWRVFYILAGDVWVERQFVYAICL